ncbi:MAG: bifunctional riboflavin kinase/FAD synthetase [Flavobacteriales bacterium]|nr:bifunctional riboflavin kinase/FAD synthetase [Flavobacteriales bacterium]
MKIHTDITDFYGVKRPVLTTGTFDGVHMGHRKILQRLKEIAQREEGESVLFTFHPHPRMVLFPHDNDLKLLSTQKERTALLEEAGIDHLLVVPFTRTFSRMTALEYVRNVLVDGLGLHAMVIGHDHRFGRNREGDIHLLRQYGEAYDFKVEEIPAEEIDHVKVSSTKVRQALQAGDVEHARQWLGYEYPITGLVVKGDQLGRTIGFPTANIALTDSYKLVPGDGVYAVRVSLRDGEFTGMLNIGKRPTVQGDGERTVEVHVLGLDRDLYGEGITVRFSQRVRDERKFDGLDALKEQLMKDRDRVLGIFGSKA